MDWHLHSNVLFDLCKHRSPFTEFILSLLQIFVSGKDISINTVVNDWVVSWDFGFSFGLEVLPFVTKLLLGDIGRNFSGLNISVNSEFLVRHIIVDWIVWHSCELFQIQFLSCSLFSFINVSVSGENIGINSEIIDLVVNWVSSLWLLKSGLQFMANLRLSIGFAIIGCNDVLINSKIIDLIVHWIVRTLWFFWGSLVPWSISVNVWSEFKLLA